MTESEHGSGDTFPEHFMAQEAEEDDLEEDSSKIMNFVEVKCEPPSPDTDHEEEIQESKTEAVVEEDPDQVLFIMEETPFIKFEPVWSSDTEESFDLESNVQLPSDLVKVESTNSVKEEFELEDVKGEFHIQENVPGEDLQNESQSPLESSNSFLPTFDHRTSLRVTSHIIEDAKPLKCSTCKKTFFGSDQLKTHKLEHSSVRPYSCSLCGKSFTQRTILKRHMIIHSAERPHCCTICMRSFTRYDYLKSHLLVHAEEKPLSCGTCGKTFLRLSHLRSHSLRHSGEKPFLCITCGKTFFSSSSLKRHIKKKSHESLTT